jgi:hypothetical protein
MCDISIRLHNLQMGLGEGLVGNDILKSPYNKSSRVFAGDAKDWPKADFTAMVTFNQTVHFHDMEGLKADEWILMEGNTSSAFGGRVMLHSRMWSREGVLRATCTQEAYYRLKPEGAAKALKSHL